MKSFRIIAHLVHYGCSADTGINCRADASSSVPSGDGPLAGFSRVPSIRFFDEIAGSGEPARTRGSAPRRAYGDRTNRKPSVMPPP